MKTNNYLGGVVMKKRIIILVFTLIFILVLQACTLEGSVNIGNNNSDNGNTNNSGDDQGNNDNGDQPLDTDTPVPPPPG